MTLAKPSIKNINLSQMKEIRFLKKEKHFGVEIPKNILTKSYDFIYLFLNHVYIFYSFNCVSHLLAI